MTLYEIVDIIKKTALDQPNIRTTTDGSVYDALNTNPSIQYDVFHISQTNHQEDFETDYYGLQLFYISRLEDSLEDNRLQIQSIGKEILGNVIRTFCENFSIDYPTITYIPFTQKFNDLTAGVYCNVRLEIPKDLVCPDNYLTEVIPGSDIRLQDLGVTITQNGLRVITPDFPYDGIGEIRIVTDVPQAGADLQYKEVEYTENGEYTVRPDPDYDGLTEVAVSVVVPDRYDEGYDDGKEDGIDEQKAKLESLSVSANGEYTRADGYSAITVDVPQYSGGTYQEGYEDGEAAQKAKLVSTAVTENGTYSKEDGYSAITVNVPSDYQDGYDDGEAAQKAKLSTTSVTENGTYSREDGYSAITVNVPQGQGYEEGYEDGEAAQKAKLTVTSFTQNDTYTRTDGWSAVTINVDDRYDEGYDEGVADQKAKLSSTTFTDNGTYTNTDGWSSVTVDSPWRDYFITGITLNVDSAITNYGTATTTYSPSTAFTNIYYTSSDPTIATIDSGTGIITVLSSGTVTICAQDSITHLQDCKQITVTYDESKQMSFNITGDGDIVWKASSTGFITTIQYKKNNGDWTNITATTGGTRIPVVVGDVLKFRGDNPTYCNGDTSVYGHIENSFSGSTAQFEISGNIMSLIDSAGYHTATTLNSDYTFEGLFQCCTGLTSAENLELPATTLRDRCYNNMFGGCTSLTTAPSILPASTVSFAAYHSMFANCTSLTTAPELPATTLMAYCYNQMFYNCTSLTTAPELPATTLANYCYASMFYNCTSLTTAPTLPATTLAYYCYLGMFADCTSLTTAPELPATTLVRNCYDSMFQGCTSLNYIKCLATDISASDCTTNWVSGVASTGTFVKDANMEDWTIGINGIPENWTVVDNS